MTPKKKDWTAELKKLRNGKAENYAKTILTDPAKTTMTRALPFPGVELIMGHRRRGKSGLAHRIAEEYHKRKKVGAVLHLPAYVPIAMRKDVQKLLPNWMKVVTSTDEWPINTVVIYDEAAQSAHARRSQSGNAVKLDNLVSISGQRNQLILAVSHHSRKVDLNLVHEVDGIIWKQPTMAHAMFERDEMTDFTYKAYTFFNSIKGEVARKKANLMIDLNKFEFLTFTNTLPGWWSDKLSKLFQDIEQMAERR